MRLNDRSDRDIMSALVDEMLKSLEIREVKSLLSHEKVISHNLKKLKEAMLNIGHLVDPMIVDKKTGVVLDGNHRLKVLEIIECPYAVCQTVDYSSDEIKVGTWYPVMDLDADKVFKLDSIKHEKVDYEAGKAAVDALKAPFMLVTKNDGCHLLNPGSYKLMEMVEEQNYIFSLLEKTAVDYVPAEELQKHMDNGKSVFFRRSYTKDEIVRAAQAHSPFPPKSTRHLIPGRIIRLNMKLGWLHRSPEEAEAELHSMLNSRVYSGNVRKYYEPVIVIY
jgi:L-serine kinase (ADP)